jgi:hypothetical protein
VSQGDRTNPSTHIPEKLTTVQSGILGKMRVILILRSGVVFTHQRLGFGRKPECFYHLLLFEPIKDNYWLKGRVKPEWLSQKLFFGLRTSDRWSTGKGITAFHGFSALNN